MRDKRGIEIKLNSQVLYHNRSGEVQTGKVINLPPQGMESIIYGNILSDQTGKIVRRNFTTEVYVLPKN